ncbi:MAG: CBS domain-containing protein, partial [Nitrososphaeraceae archaeon]
MIIEEFMSRNLEYASMTDSLQQAVMKMTDKNVSSLVVVDTNNIPIGLVTERDIVRKACSLEQLNCSTFRVSEIMTSSPVTIVSEATPEEAAELFLKNKIR